MLNKNILLILVLLQLGLSSLGSVYYVSPNGADANPGSKAQPLYSIRKAQQLVLPGDTVWVRGGTYSVREADITTYSRIQAFVVLLDKSGAENKRINYWAFPGEKPVFDFSSVKPANYRVHAFEVTGSWIHLKGLEVTGVQVTITNVNTQSICFSNAS